MKLHYSQTSPYVRKVMMVVHEAGLVDRVSIVPTDVRAPDSPIAKANPLAKIPALVLDDGSTLYDSPVICEYLDSLHAGRPLFPEPGPARWTALRQQALADGICDASVLRRMETLRPESQRSADWDAHQRRAVLRALDQLELEVALLPAPDRQTIGGLAVLAALGYLDFRFGAEGWRKGRPALAGWFTAAATLPAFAATAPPVE